MTEREAKAKAILETKFSENDHRRMAVLAARSNEGTLTEDEKEELETYVRLGNMLALMHSKARLWLGDGSSSST
jgi:hypothetical protein